MSHRSVRFVSLISVLALFLSLAGTGARVVSATGPVLAHPILFVTQVPTKDDPHTVVTTFGNHEGGVRSAARGGDLWVRFQDGTLKNLTAAAGYGMNGFQGATSIAVRDPAVYWDGTKAVFSMVIGAPVSATQIISPVWQLYEVSGIQYFTQTVAITPVSNQPAGYNNLMPTYGTDDRIIFVSDKPRAGSAIYPALDEYNLFTTNTGLWSLNPANGNIFQIDTQPSGDFSPSVDSFGRLIFIRWDHLERDQEADYDALYAPLQCKYCTFNYSDETITATNTMTNVEVYPEPRPARTDLLAGTNLHGHHMNEFLPWSVNQDGTSAETINHIGRHELKSSIPAAFTNDANLVDFYYTNTVRFNPNPIDKFLQIKEAPAQPGTYYGVNVLELTHGAGQIISMTAPPVLDADHIAIANVTISDTYYTNYTNTVNSTGHYRDPLPLSDGTLIAAHSVYTGFESLIPPYSTMLYSKFDFRLKTLQFNSGYWVPNQLLTSGISETVSFWYSSTLMVSYSGNLWELYPVEVVSRTRPTATIAYGPGAPELQMFTQAGVDPAQLQAWLIQHNLALAVSRNVTTRDDADRQQPFNLRVGLTGTTTITGTGTPLYRIDFMQFFQGDQLRGLTGNYMSSVPLPGRRVLAQPFHDTAALAYNLPNPSGPAGSVILGQDGSMAAFLPARRPMSWQLTDNTGVPVVRERFWITYQPGEMRVCTSCHGLNVNDQAGNAAPQNPPQALYDLLVYWKGQNVPPSSLYLPLVSH